MRSKWWKMSRTQVLDEIRSELASGFPSLHLFEQPGQDPEVRGTFEVRGEGGSVLDTFLIRIQIPPSYPRDLPVVWEVGGRIPCLRDRHIESDGKACILLPDERWRTFPVGASFTAYLRGPLHSFFLSQVAFELTGEWPFGEWGHGGHGIEQFYQETLGTHDLLTIALFLESLSKGRFDPFRSCPCGSGVRLGACCRKKWLDLRQKVDPQTAERSLKYLVLENPQLLKPSKPPRRVSGDTPASRLIRAAGGRRGIC